MVSPKKPDKKALLYRGNDAGLAKALESSLKKAEIKCSVSAVGVSFKNVIFDGAAELKCIYCVKVKKTDLSRAKRLLTAAGDRPKRA